MAQRIDLLKSVARNLSDLILDGVPASLTGSTIDHLDLIHPLSNQLQGFYFYLYSGAGVGQARIVGSFNPANRRLVFPQGFTTIPSTNSNFILTKDFPKLDYDNALDRFIGIAKQSYLEDKVATMQCVATQYEYAVPSGMKWISNLRLVPSGSSDYGADDEVDRIFEIHPRNWRIEQNPTGSYLIVIDSRKVDMDVLDKEWLRVLGQAPPDIAGTDNATIPANLEEFIIVGASMQLASDKIDESRKWQAKFYMFRDELQGRPGQAGLEAYIFRTGRGKKVES